MSIYIIFKGVESIMDGYIAVITNISHNSKKYDELFGIDYNKENVIYYENADSVIKSVAERGRPSLILIDAIEKTGSEQEIINKIQNTYLLAFIPVIIAGPDDDIEYEKRCLGEWEVVDFMPYSTIESLLALHASVHIRRYEWAFIDRLTNVFTRRHYEEIKARIFRFCAEEGKKKSCPVSLCMIDIDYFKEYNDNYEHQKGDGAISSVAVKIREVVPPDGFVARYGGDEFIVLLPNVNEKRAVEIANKIVEAVRQANIPHEFRNKGKEKGIVTVSVGATTGYVVSKADDVSIKKFIEEFLEKADKNMYKAKKNGKNGFFHDMYIHEN